MIELLFSSLFLIALVFFLSLATVEIVVWGCRRLGKTALPALLLIILTTAPFLLATTLLLAFSLTLVGKGVGLIADHCLVHGLNHPHLCFDHLPAVQLSALAVLGVSFMAFFVVVKLAMQLKNMHKYARIHGSVTQFYSNRLNWLDSEREMAFVTGIRKPRIYLAQRLKQRLSKRTLRIIVAHEVQHIRNRDLLKMLLIECLLSFYGRAAKNYLINQWVLYREQKVDRQLAHRFGRAAVADALLQMLPIKKHQTGLNSTGGDIELRITALLHCRDRTLLSAHRATQLIAVFAVSLIVFLIIEHHALETLIGWIN